MLSEGKLEELEKVARAATAQTPDTWFIDRSQDPTTWTDGLVVAAGDRYGTALAHVTRGWEGDPHIPESSHGLALATHIATFDPPTVLALISELRALRAERKVEP